MFLSSYHYAGAGQRNISLLTSVSGYLAVPCCSIREMPGLPHSIVSNIQKGLDFGASGGSRQAATVVRLVTGQPFVGSYTARFHPRKRTSPACGLTPAHHQILPTLQYERARPVPPSALPVTGLSCPCQPSTLFGARTKSAGRHS
jgi:hypothetical protein